MAMNLGTRTTKLFVDTTNRELRISNDQWEDPWTDGDWGGLKVYAESQIYRELTEEDFIDIGYVTDEREEVAAGGFAITWIGKGADTRQNISISGKILRVTLSGIIPDGIYRSVDVPDQFYANKLPDGTTRSFSLNGLSNASVFRYKMNKYFAYTNFFGTSGKNYPNSVQYRRRLIKEAYDWFGSDPKTNDSDIARYVVTGYSIGFIAGTRNITYTITLDMAGNAGLLAVGHSPLSDLTKGIRPNTFGSL